MTDDAKAREAGLALRRQMFGPGGAEEALANASDFTKPLQEFVTDFCFGDVWQRDGLDARTRSMLTLAVLAALGKTPQLRNHVHGAIKNGVTQDEIREILLHVMVYAGVPAAVEATMAAEDVLTGME